MATLAGMHNTTVRDLSYRTLNAQGMTAQQEVDAKFKELDEVLRLHCVDGTVPDEARKLLDLAYSSIRRSLFAAEENTVRGDLD